VEHTSISNEELLELDVDILIPAALDGVIGKHNVDNIKANYIVEVANGPVLSDVDATLHEREIHVVPDVLANAGGVTVSYFEWVQNRSGYAWDLDTVHQRLGDIMSKSFNEVWDLAQNEKRSMRNAAYTLAFRRIGEAVNAHGTRDYFNSSD